MIFINSITNLATNSYVRICQKTRVLSFLSEKFQKRRKYHQVLFYSVPKSNTVSDLRMDFWSQTKTGYRSIFVTLSKIVILGLFSNINKVFHFS